MNKILCENKDYFMIFKEPAVKLFGIRKRL